MKSAGLEELKTAERTEGDIHQKNPGNDHCKLINISPPSTQNHHHMRNLSQGVKNGRKTSPLQGFQTEDVILRVSSEVTMTTKTSDDMQQSKGGSPVTMTKMAPTT